MIEKIIPEHIIGLDGLPTTIMPDSAKLMRKLNELVDAVNELQKHEEQHLDLLTQLNEMRLHQNKEPADIGELAYLQKENSDLKDKVKKLQSLLEKAENALKGIADINVLFCQNDYTKNIARQALMELNNE